MKTGYLSARSRVIYVADSDDRFERLTLEVREPGTPEFCPRWQMVAELRNAQDVATVEVENTEAALELLELSIDVNDALDLTLWLLDATLSDETRCLAAAELEEVLALPGLEAEWRGLFWARSVGSAGDFGGALRLLNKVPNAALVHRLVRDLCERQSAIQLVEQAFKGVAAERQWTAEKARNVLRVVLQAKVPVELVEAVHSGGDSLLRVLFGRSSDAGLRSQVASWAGVLQAWVRGCQGQVDRSSSAKGRAAEWADGRERAKEAQEAEERVEVRRGGADFDRGAAKSRVARQKDSILRCMKQQDWARVEREVQELVATQCDQGGPEYACKSLCDLAQRAHESGHERLHLAWSQWAVELSPEDGWAWGQLGHARRLAGDWEAALEAYAHAGVFGYQQISGTGRSETLKALGRYEEALASYEAVIKEFPQDVVAQNGRLSLLLSMGLPRQVWEETADWDPRRDANWVGLHIRAVAAVRLGLFEPARTLLEQGLAEAPLPHRPYFASTLAAWRLNTGDYSTSRTLLAEQGHRFTPPLRLLLLGHLEGATNNTQAAASALATQPEWGGVTARHVWAELRGRFVTKEGPVQSDQWLFERELDLTLIAA
ncbi:MAG: hypothetical protein ACK5HA_08935 [Planctomycetaceae bacterium]